MREILFRGKRVSDGEWVEGWLSQTTIIPEDGPSFVGLVINAPYEKPFDAEWHIIDPATVGQYTGLKDKNGKRIFEGDILRYYDDEIQVVEWSDEWSRTMLHTYGERERKNGRKTIKVKHEGWNDLDDYPLKDMPIIGNIHDNPELLEVEE